MTEAPGAPGAAPRTAADEVGVAAHLLLGDLLDGARIDGDDGHHLQRARRRAIDEQVTAADGAGRWRRYRIIGAQRGALELEASGPIRTEPESPFEIVVAPALISRNRFDAMVAQLTELGVDAIVPLVAERCVARWDGPGAPAVLDRLTAVAREAAMQCRRSRLPRIETPRTPSQLAATDARIVVAVRDGAGVAGLRAPTRAGLVIVTGPEGGLSPRDLDALGDCDRLRLGRHVLRAETAPVAAAALLAERRDEREEHDDVLR